jgi:anti-sigma factor ChrR (cupin superfamily)
MTQTPGTSITHPEDLNWEAVGPLDENGRGIFISPIYGDTKTKGPTYFLMKYSAGVKAPPRTHSGDYYSVVVSGSFRHYLETEQECEVLTTGAAWFQKGTVAHQDRCVGSEDCILAIFWPEGFDVELAEGK